MPFKTKNCAANELKVRKKELKMRKSVCSKVFTASGLVL